MKEIRGMKRGVKMDPQPTNSQRLQQVDVELQQVDVELQNLQQSGRITQLMVQQLLSNMEAMQKDLGKSFGIINELQYKVLAMQKVGGFDMDALAKQADEMRLNDFIEASDAEDKAQGFTIGETVQNDSTVIITSTTVGADAGIFRSRIKLASCGVPALVEGFAGKQVGTKVVCQLNGLEHTVELLGIRNPPPAQMVAPVGEVAVEPDGSETQMYQRVPADGTVH